MLTETEQLCEQGQSNYANKDRATMLTETEQRCQQRQSNDANRDRATMPTETEQRCQQRQSNDAKISSEYHSCNPFLSHPFGKEIIWKELRYRKFSFWKLNLA